MIDRDDILFLVRTHYVDEGVLALLGAMRAGGYDVALLLDARCGDDAAGFPVVPVSRAAVETLGLFAPDDFTWRCGDYGLYLAMRAYPAKTHFWMIEPDVFIHSDDPAAFFDAMLGVDAALLCGWLRPAARRWYWADSVARLGLEPWRMLYALVRLRRDALEQMLARRLAMSRDWQGTGRWPNDEALTGAVVQAARLDCRDFNAIGPTPLYSEQDYSFDQPRARCSVETKPVDDRLHHPVLAGDRYIAKIARLIGDARARHSFSSLAFFDRRVFADLRLEGGISAALRFAARVFVGRTDALLYGLLRRLRLRPPPA